MTGRYTGSTNQTGSAEKRRIGFDQSATPLPAAPDLASASLPSAAEAPKRFTLKEQLEECFSSEALSAGVPPFEMVAAIAALLHDQVEQLVPMREPKLRAAIPGLLSSINESLDQLDEMHLAAVEQGEHDLVDGIVELKADTERLQAVLMHFDLSSEFSIGDTLALKEGLIDFKRMLGHFTNGMDRMRAEEAEIQNAEERPKMFGALRRLLRFRE